MIPQEDLEKIRKAKSQMVEGSITIWNARLDALIRAGDAKGVIAHVLLPVEPGFLDACSCDDCSCTASEMHEGMIGALRQSSRR